jgi:hypothetical protein
METFAKLFERFLVFVYHCFDRIVIQGYLPLLTRPELIVHFFRDVRPISHHLAGPGQAHFWNIAGGWKAMPAITKSPC